MTGFTQDHASEVRKLFFAKKWDETEKKIKGLPQELVEGDEFPYLIFLAKAQINQKKYAEAVASLHVAFARLRRPESLLEPRVLLGLCYAGMGKDELAFSYLKDAARAGAVQGYLLNEPEFEKLRSDKRFAEVREEFKRNTFPCEMDPNYSRLDFFVGNWEVFLDEGKTKVAVDSIFKVSRGCAIVENFYWTQGAAAGGGYQGKSFSFYDAPKQKVLMNWAGSNGDIRIFEEQHSSPNAIELLAITVYRKGLVHRKMKMNYNPTDDTIHQIIANSYDLGANWVVEWDAIFRRSK